MTSQPGDGGTTPDLVVFGDSVAKGCDDPDPAGGWIGWARRLAINLGLPRQRLHNVAMRGAGLGDVARSQIPAVRHLRPRLVLLSCGVNDALHPPFDKPALVGHLWETLNWARGTGATTVVAPVPLAPLMTRPVLSQLRRNRTHQRVKEVNEELSLAAHQFGAVWLAPEGLPELAGRALWSADGIHLSAAGHAYVATVVTPIARRAFYERSTT